MVHNFCIILETLFHFSAEIKLTGEHQMRSIVKSFGGWPVADQSWTDTMAPSIETVCGQAMRQLNDAIIFDSWVGPDDTNSSSHVILVSYHLQMR